MIYCIVKIEQLVKRSIKIVKIAYFYSDVYMKYRNECPTKMITIVGDNGQYNSYTKYYIGNRPYYDELMNYTFSLLNYCIQKQPCCVKRYIKFPISFSFKISSDSIMVKDNFELTSLFDMYESKSDGNNLSI